MKGPFQKRRLARSTTAITPSVQPPHPLSQPPPASVPENFDSSLPNVSELPATSSLGSGNFPCDRCDRIFDKRHELNTHQSRQCYRSLYYACLVAGCNQKFQYQKDLDRHTNVKHPGPDTAVFHCSRPGCKYAADGKHFKRKDNLKRHLKSQHPSA
ncbi:hypothetical protein F5B18DRAFT_657362 [Nemania serpens]|nr:hypothetical protein F5B18DRAFT_657362 [Nemania serpens]